MAHMGDPGRPIHTTRTHLEAEDQERLFDVVLGERRARGCVGEWVGGGLVVRQGAVVHEHVGQAVEGVQLHLEQRQPDLWGRERPRGRGGWVRERPRVRGGWVRGVHGEG